MKKLFETIEWRQVLVTVSNTRKVDLSMISIQILHFAAQCLENLHIKKRKNEQHWVS